MDFASALANLQKSANAAASSSGNSNSRNTGSRSPAAPPPVPGSGGGGPASSSYQRGGGGAGDGDGAGAYYGGGGGAGDRSYYPRGGGRGGGDYREYDGGGGGGRRRPRESDQQPYNYDWRGRNQRPRRDDYRGGGGPSSSSPSSSNYYGRPPASSSSDYPRGGERGGPAGRDRSRSVDGGAGGIDRLLEPMARFGYRVSAFRGPPPPPSPDAPPRRKHICLLALTIDDLPYEAIWREWASGNSGGSGSGKPPLVSLICHAKFPAQVQSPWLRRRLLVRAPRIGRGNSYADPEFLTHRPEWGSVQLTRAMIDCAAAGLRIGNSSGGNNKDDNAETDPRFSSDRFAIHSKEEGGDAAGITASPPVDSFIFISETCLPVRSLEECAREMYGPDPAAAASASNATGADDTEGKEQLLQLQHHRSHQSWLKARNRKTPGTPRNKYERDQFNGIGRTIPQPFRWKSDQWMLLSRCHAAAVLGIDSHFRRPQRPPIDRLWNVGFAKISASDEMYFPTALAILGILREEEGEDDTSDNNKKGDIQQPQPSAAAAAEDPDNNSKDKGAASTPTPMRQVLRRQVTYVDWSEGMRNPAAYDRGVRDFVRVGRLARANGSLFARKFVPYVPVPGKDPVVTGALSAEEWKEQVAKLAREEEEAEKEAKTAASIATASTSTVTATKPAVP